MPQNSNRIPDHPPDRFKSTAGSPAAVTPALTSRMLQPDNTSNAGSANAGPAASSFAARFGRIILSHGIAVVPTALYHFQGKLDLSAQLVWFISNILSHKWDQDLPYPSLNKIAKCAGIDKSRLYDYKEELCRLGLLNVIVRSDATGRRDTNAYDFAPLFSYLEALIAAETAPDNPIRGDGDTPAQFAQETEDTSFVARYGRVITSYGITAVPRAIYTHGAALNLSLQQVWFITHILSYKWDTPLPYPSIKRMSVKTGYSTKQLHQIKNELVQAGYLRLVARYANDGAQDSNAYDFSDLLAIIEQILEQPSITAQEEEEASNVIPILERSRRRGRKRTSQVQSDFLKVGGAQVPGVGGTYIPGVGGAQVSEAITSALPTSVAHRYQGIVARGSHELEAIQEETNKDDSNRISLRKNDQRERIPQPVKYSPYIAQVVIDYSLELGDSVHQQSNVRQALNLWGRSELTEQAFVELLHEARARTRTYQGRPSWDPMNNKMAYFFTTLRSFLQPEPGQE